MKKAFMILCCVMASLTAQADPPLSKTVDFSGSTAPALQFYQSNYRTVKWYFGNNNVSINAAGQDPYMWIAASNKASQVVTAACTWVTQTSGVFNAVLNPSDLNTNGSFVYGVGIKSNGVPTTARQGTLTIIADPYYSASAISYTVPFNAALYTYSNGSNGVLVAGSNITLRAVGSRGQYAIDGASGTGSGDMLKSENLSGLANYTIARSNLGLGTASTNAEGAFATAAQGLLAASALQSVTQHNQTLSTITDAGTIASRGSNDFYLASNPDGYISSYTESDPIFTNWISTNVYIKTETDPIWSAVSNTVTEGAALGATALQLATNLHTSSTQLVISGNARVAYDGSNQKSIDWGGAGNRYLYANGEGVMVDWNNAQLLQNNTLMVNWITGILYTNAVLPTPWQSMGIASSGSQIVNHDCMTGYVAGATAGMLTNSSAFYAAGSTVVAASNATTATTAGTASNLVVGANLNMAGYSVTNGSFVGNGSGLTNLPVTQSSQSPFTNNINAAGYTITNLGTLYTTNLYLGSTLVNTQIMALGNSPLSNDVLVFTSTNTVGSTNAPTLNGANITNVSKLVFPVLSVSLTTNINLAANVDTICPAQNIFVDTHSGFNTNTYKYTIPSAFTGYYLVNGIERFGAAMTNNCNTMLYEITPAGPTNNIGCSVVTTYRANCSASCVGRIVTYTGGTHIIYMSALSANSLTNVLVGAPPSGDQLSTSLQIQYLRGL